MNFQTYLESWDVNYLNVLANQPITSNTIITLAFGSFNFDSTEVIGGITLTKEQIQSIITQVKSKGGKTVISFGGKTYKLSASNLWPNTTAVAQAIANIVQTYGFDGCDLDIEEQQSDKSFANKVLAVIQGIRSTLPKTMMTLTIPGQGWNTYWQPLAIGAYTYVDAINFMEYDLWVGSDYVTQIKSDITDYYINAWGIPSGKIVMGLMPGTDDQSRPMTLDMTNTLVAFAKSQNLAGVMIWDMNRDFQGLGGNPSFAYTNAIINGLK